jgi:hypothetical protein
VRKLHCPLPSRESASTEFQRCDQATSGEAPRRHGNAQKLLARESDSVHGHSLRLIADLDQVSSRTDVDATAVGTRQSWEPPPPWHRGGRQCRSVMQAGARWAQRCGQLHGARQVRVVRRARFDRSSATVLIAGQGTASTADETRCVIGLPYVGLAPYCIAKSATDRLTYFMTVENQTVFHELARVNRHPPPSPKTHTESVRIRSDYRSAPDLL